MSGLGADQGYELGALTSSAILSEAGNNDSTPQAAIGPKFTHQVKAPTPQTGTPPETSTAHQVPPDHTSAKPLHAETSPFPALARLLEERSVPNSGGLTVTAQAKDGDIAELSFPGIQNTPDHRVTYTASPPFAAISAVHRDLQGRVIAERMISSTDSTRTQEYLAVYPRFEEAARDPLADSQMRRRLYKRRGYMRGRDPHFLNVDALEAPSKINKLRGAKLLNELPSKVLDDHIDVYVGFVNITPDTPDTNDQHWIKNIEQSLKQGGKTLQLAYVPPDSKFWDIRGLPGVKVNAGDPPFNNLENIVFSDVVGDTNGFTVWKRSTHYEVRRNNSDGKPHGTSETLFPTNFDEDAASWIKKRILAETPAYTVERNKNGIKLTPLKNPGITVNQAEWRKDGADARLEAIANLQSGATSFTLSRDPDAEIGNVIVRRSEGDTNPTVKKLFSFLETMADSVTLKKSKQGYCLIFPNDASEKPLNSNEGISYNLNKCSEPIAEFLTKRLLGNHHKYNICLTYPGGKTDIKWDISDNSNDPVSQILPDLLLLGDPPSITPIPIPNNDDFQDQYDFLDRHLQFGDAVVQPNNTQLFGALDARRRVDFPDTKDKEVKYFTLTRSGANISVTPRVDEAALEGFSIKPEDSELFNPAFKQLNEREFPQCAENTPVIFLMFDHEKFVKDEYRRIIQEIIVGERYVVRDGAPIPTKKPVGEPTENGKPTNGVYLHSAADGRDSLLYKGDPLKGLNQKDVNYDHATSEVYVGGIHIGHKSASSNRIYVDDDQWLQVKDVPQKRAINECIPWSIMRGLITDVETINPVIRDIAGKAKICIAISSDPHVEDWLNHHLRDKSDPDAKATIEKFVGDGLYREYGKGVSESAVAPLAAVAIGLGVFGDQVGRRYFDGWSGFLVRSAIGAAVNGVNNVASIVGICGSKLQSQGLPHSVKDMLESCVKRNHPSWPIVRDHLKGVVKPTIFGAAGNLPIGAALTAGVENNFVRQLLFAFSAATGASTLPQQYVRDSTNIKIAHQANVIDEKTTLPSEVDKSNLKLINKHTQETAQADHDTRSGPKMMRFAYNWGIGIMVGVGTVLNLAGVPAEWVETVQSGLAPSAELVAMVLKGRFAKEASKAETREIAEVIAFSQAEKLPIDSRVLSDHAGNQESPPGWWEPFSLAQTAFEKLGVGNSGYSVPLTNLVVTNGGPKKKAAAEAQELPKLIKAATMASTGSKCSSSFSETLAGLSRLTTTADSQLRPISRQNTVLSSTFTRAVLSTPRNLEAGRGVSGVRSG